MTTSLHRVDEFGTLAGATVVGVEEVAGGVRVRFDEVLELDGAAQPACVAQVLSRLNR